MTQLEKVFFNGKFVEPWTEVPEGKLRDKAVAKFVQQYGVKKSMLQEYNVQKLNPKFNAKLSKLKNITNWAQTGPSPLNRILPKLFGKTVTKALTVPAAISDVLLGTKLTSGRSDWRLPGFADFNPETKWYEGWGAENVFGDKETPKVTALEAPPGRPVSKTPTIASESQPAIPKETKPQDMAQGQGRQREEQQQRQRQQRQIQQEKEKYKDTATTGAKAGYTYGLQSGGKIRKKIKKVKNKYSKGGGVRAAKYKL